MARQAKVTTISTAVGTVCLMRDATLGTGAYGQVCRATLDGKPCAAKLLHPILVDPNNPRNLTKFEQECRLLSEIRHPNIVQCLGVTRDGETGLPVLMMELMDDSLTHFLEQSEEPLAYHVQVNISHDIALAVAFLHSKRIIHRDLSSNNVLLSDDGSWAKVTDFGMSKLDSHMTGLTKCPGTAAYMAPEALLDPPVYTEKLDCFQMGVLMIQIVTRKFPKPGPATLRVRDPRYPTGWINAPVPEVKRRQNHLSLISQAHPMLHIAVDCLKDTDSERPSAQQICRDLSALKEKPEGDASSDYSQQICQELSALKVKPGGDDSSDYYDILLLGRTGFGKSTTGIKLLVSGEETIMLWGKEEDVTEIFETGYGAAYKKRKLLSNEHNVRVLDTPGFADTGLTKEHGLMECNLPMFRWILQEQKKHNLAFCRVLYFLPFRGPPERAEGTLQEEIKVMYEFLGEDVFKIMVIIATNRKKRQFEFDREDIDITKEAFTVAYEKATGKYLPTCPPILYLPFTETDVLNKIVVAKVIRDEPLKRLNGQWCMRCFGKFEESKCHPIFIPKHSQIVKMIGGIAHVVTLGILAGVARVTGGSSWPSFWNDEVICPVCGLSPGSKGCSDVGKLIDVPSVRRKIKTSHSTIIDEMA